MSGGGLAARARRLRRDVAYLRSAFPLRLVGPVVALAVAPVPSWTARTWRHLQRHRAVAAPAPPRTAMHRALRTATGRRQLAYHLAVAPLLAVAALTLAAGALIAVALLTVPLWMWAVGDSRIGTHSPDITAAYLCLLGFLALIGLLGLVPSLARADESATVGLLGPTRGDTLARQLDELAGNRRAVLEAADAERRRIERDLHDGAQQRLVALSMNLGLAEVALPELPDSARRVLADARRQADAALADITGLVRGLHPPILEDRGLVPALSSLAADSPLPVTLAAPAELARAAPAVESVAYFVVAEALTNAVKHAAAHTAVVRADRAADHLVVSVTDDGHGGAHAAGGTGLAGLARRVASVGGRLSVASPAGGPTTVEARLPCGP